MTEKESNGNMMVSKSDTKKGEVIMDKKRLEAMMKLNGDTGRTLAEYLGINRTTFSSKINETNGAGFTQSEIKSIKRKYNLSAEDIDIIFFGS